MYKLFFYLPSPPPPFCRLRFAVFPVRFLNRFLISSSRRPSPLPPLLFNTFARNCTRLVAGFQKNMLQHDSFGQHEYFFVSMSIFVRNEQTVFRRFKKKSEKTFWILFTRFSTIQTTGTCTASYACTFYAINVSVNYTDNTIGVRADFDFWSSLEHN